jgi:hypothetical protein
MAHKNDENIDLQNFDNGVYYLKVTTSKRTSTHKFIKSNK